MMKKPVRTSPTPENGNGNGNASPKWLYDKSKLLPQEFLFIQHYLENGFNGTEAYTRAYNCATRTTAGTESCKLLKIPKIREAVQEAVNAKAARLQITADRVLQELARVGLANAKDLYNEDGRLLSPAELPRDVAAAIGYIEEIVYEGRGDDREAVGRIKKITLKNKHDALKLLAQHLDLLGEFRVKVEHEHDHLNNFDFSTLSEEELFQFLSLMKKMQPEEKHKQRRIEPDRGILEVNQWKVQ